MGSQRPQGTHGMHSQVPRWSNVRLVWRCGLRLFLRPSGTLSNLIRYCSKTQKGRGRPPHQFATLLPPRQVRSAGCGQRPRLAELTGGPPHIGLDPKLPTEGCCQSGIGNQFRGSSSTSPQFRGLEWTASGLNRDSHRVAMVRSDQEPRHP